MTVSFVRAGALLLVQAAHPDTVLTAEGRAGSRVVR
jgi:hypothetical protein